MAKTSFRWLRTVGLLLFAWIVIQIDWRTVWALLKGLRPWYVAAYLAVFVVALLLKVFRLQRALYQLGHCVSFKAAYRSVIESAFHGMVTPARLGEFSKVGYLTQLGLGSKQAWAVVMMERLVDFSVLLIASISGLLLFFAQLPQAAAVGIFLALLLMLYLAIRHLSGLLTLVWRVWQALPWSANAIAERTIVMQEAASRLSLVSVKTLLPTALIVLMLSFWQLSLLGDALDASVPGVYLGLAYATSSLVSLLPLSVGGLGTREAVYIGLLAPRGLAPDLAVTISLLDGLILTLFAQSALYFPFIIARRSGGKA